MKEMWKVVPGSSGKYYASSKGRIKNSKGYIISPYVHKGYLTFSFLGKTTVVHRIITKTFIGSIGDGLQVNHKNGDKLNNNVSNLEIVTPAQNNLHARRTLSISNSGRKVGMYSKDLKLIKVYKSAYEASKFGFKGASIRGCCRGERKSHKGFIWKYI